MDYLRFYYRFVGPNSNRMARLAGLALRERWTGWHRKKFTEQRDDHVCGWAWEDGKGGAICDLPLPQIGVRGILFIEHLSYCGAFHCAAGRTDRPVIHAH